MRNATVVRLSPNTQVTNVMTFEQAFGEHSNAKGKLFKKAAAAVKKANPVAAVKKVTQTVKAAAPLKKIAAKVKAAAPLKKIAAKVAAVKEKRAEKKAAKAGEDLPPDDEQMADDADLADDTPADDSTETDDSSDDSVDDGSATNDEDAAQFEGHKNNNLNHAIMQNNNATVVRLSPNTQVTNVMTFEQAFGEHSNLFDGIRARMSTKRAKNQAIIQANKRAIAAEKTETKVAKQANKKAKKLARIDKRAGAQQARIAKRTTAKVGRVAGRQLKKTTRKAARIQRQNLGQDDASQLPDDTLQTTTDTSGADISPDGTTTSGDISQDYTQSSDQDNGYVTDDGSEISRGDTDDSGDFTDPYAADDGSEDDGSGDTTQDDGADDSAGDYEDSFDAQMSSFDGNMGGLSPDNTYKFMGADGQTVRARIHPKVMDAAKKVEWNKEYVSRLQANLAQGGEAQSYLTDEQDEGIQTIVNEISKKKNRALHHENKLHLYIDSSGADGVRAKRTAEVNGAMREARKQRMGQRISGMKAAKMKGKDITEIEHGLNPEITPGQIVIPPEAKSPMGGEQSSQLVSEHDYNLIDEHNYGFDGVAMIKNNWKGIAIGSVVAIAAIILITSMTKKSA